MRYFSVLCILLITSANPTYLHAQKDATLIDERAIAKLMAEHKIPALGIGLFKDGKLSGAKVYGNLSGSEPAPLNTVFNVASLTKPVVAMLTLKLVSTGKWNLDEPLAKYWIDPDVQNDSNAYKLTSRHVLAHQTGFVNWRWLHPTKKLTFDFEPGTKFQYSGEGFEYLKKALEKKYNVPLDKLCDSLVFQPLEMRDTRFTWSDEIEPRFARWHDKEGKNSYETYKSTSASAADDLLTTIEDYGKFGSAVMNGFGLPDSLFQDMITPRSALGKSSSMCLSWELFTALPGDEYAIMHTGSDRGVKALILLFPKSKRGLLVFSNSDNGNQIYPQLVELAFAELGSALVKKAQ